MIVCGAPGTEPGLALAGASNRKSKELKSRVAKAGVQKAVLKKKSGFDQPPKPPDSKNYDKIMGC